MFFQRIDSQGLSHYSYLLGSGGEAAVIDPRRDCREYLELARGAGLEIAVILETHRHEDFVTGSLELAANCGARICHGPGLEWGFGETLKDGQRFKLGRLELTAIHTPGHTVESVTYAASDTESGNATVIAFTGDALFVDEVGRVDLAGAEHAGPKARDLYRSLQERILPLGDGAILCPAHGGGSVCGGHISDRALSTIGVERLQNPMLRLAEAEFVSRKSKEKLHHPPYFGHMEKLNLQGPPSLDRSKAPQKLQAEAFQDAMHAGAVVLDCRLPPDFCGAHIPGAYSIWLAGIPQFAGWVLRYDRPVALVVPDEGSADQATRYLARLGFDDLNGYLVSMEGWYNSGLPIESLEALSVHRLKAMLDCAENTFVLDVRGEHEYSAGHIDGAVNIYVGRLEHSLDLVPNNRPVAVLCNVGKRASLGASILQRSGYSNVHSVLGSMTAWVAAGYPVTRG